MPMIDPPGLLIWAAMPSGAVRSNTSTQLRLSVMLSPRLVTNSSDATVDGGEFPHFDDWPATAANLAFTVEIGGTSTVTLPAAVDASALDSATWKALFSGLRVESHTPTAPGLASRTFTTYNVRTNYNNIVGGYRPGSGSPQSARDAARASRRAARARLARLLGTTAAEHGRLRSYIDHLKRKHGVVTAATIARIPNVNTDALHFAALTDFFDGLSNGVNGRLSDGPPAPTTFDFHRAITAIARYPLLMRKLGLVLDLVVDVDNTTIDALPAQGQIRVASVASVSPWVVFMPWTAYAIDSTTGAFNTTPASDSLGVAVGMLFPLDTDTAMGLDIDAISPKIRPSLTNLPNNLAAAQDTAFPAPRSGGLALARDGFAATLQQMLTRQGSLENRLPGGTDTSTMTLNTEDLLRGFRVDVRRDGDGRWLSLHQRTGKYVLRSGVTFSNIVDEGFISLQAFNPESDKLPVLYAHETLFRWTGWSLSVPRPGKTIGPEGTAIPRNTQATSNLPLDVDFAPVPKSLPTLRFGAGYDCRLRAVDLAGNSLPQDAVTSEEFTFRLGRYLRFDPLIAPTLTMRDPAKPAESVDRIVIRSAIDSPAVETSERLVAPPKTSVQMAEWHGIFDTPTGVDTSAFQTLVNFDGEFSDAPYGSTVPTLPYLPDPVARGANLRQVAAEPPPDPSKIPFDGAWPSRQPFRLRLVEGSTPPAWDPAQRVFTISLLKGRTLTYELASYLDTGTLGDKDHPETDDVKDLAIFDYWDSLVTPRPGRPRPPQDRIPHWQEITAGGNEQLTPHRVITLVHAVPRPLLAPSLDPSNVSAIRAPGSTAAVIGVITLLDLPSTGQLEMIADWDEPVDDGVNCPSRVASSAHMGRASLDRVSIDPRTLYGGHHEFHDTKHRSVTCRLVASTRYGEYFPEIQDPAQLTQTSPTVTVDIPCSAQPLPPKVLFVVPTFGWQQSTSGDTVTRERRVGLRVYLDRPWYSSGDNERLAVRMAMAPFIVQGDNGGGDPPAPGPKPFTPTDIVPSPPQDIHDTDVASVTQWGLDPAFPGDPITSPFTPLPRHFPNAKSTEIGLLFDAFTLGQEQRYEFAYATFDVAFEPPDPADPNRAADPNRDAHNGRWYCDIDIDAGTAYLPLLRLALVRFQPSGQFWDPEGLIFYDMRFSRVALADFVQLSPGRSASIVPDANDSSLVHVTIRGPSFAPPRTALPRPEVVVGVEVNVGGELWIPFSKVDFGDPIELLGTPGSTTWSGDVRLPFERGSKPMRLTVEEYELLPADSADRNLAAPATLVRRLIYADTIAT